MSVDAYKNKVNFLSLVEYVYNRERYFVEPCIKFPSKFTLENQTDDAWLRIYFEENNKIVVEGCLYKYCDKDNKRKMNLVNLPDTHFPEINIINNISTDQWKRIDW